MRRPFFYNYSQVPYMLSVTPHIVGGEDNNGNAIGTYLTSHVGSDFLFFFRLESGINQPPAITTAPA